MDGGRKRNNVRLVETKEMMKKDVRKVSLHRSLTKVTTRVIKTRLCSYLFNFIYIIYGLSLIQFLLVAMLLWRKSTTRGLRQKRIGMCKDRTVGSELSGLSSVKGFLKTIML